MEAEKNGMFAVLSQDYQVTTNTNATALDIRRKNFSQNLLRFFYYNLSYVASNVLRSLPGAACSSTVSWLSRVSRRSRFSKEAVISLTVTRLKEESESERARRRERATLDEERLRRHSISLFSRMEGGTHPSVRSCHSPRIMVAEWVAGADQTSHNLLLLLLPFLHSFPGCL